MRIEYATERYYLAQHYAAAVFAAGGAPLYLPLIPERGFVESLSGQIGGILLPGSDSDIDPHLYGREPHTNLGAVHPEKDALDLLSIGIADELNLPLFAICFGMQSLNVARGGTLIQDIQSQVPDALKHQQGTPRNRQSHRIEIAGRSKLSVLADGKNEIRVNSHHHQAVERLGSGLQATAWASDGIIEAFEEPGERFVLGVQWHPELDAATDPVSAGMFAAFVTACAAFARKNSELVKV